MISQDIAQQHLEMIYQLKNHVKIQDGVSQGHLARVRELEGILKIVDGVSLDRLDSIYELKSQVASLKEKNEDLQKPCLQSRITNQRKQLADLQDAYSRQVSRNCRYTTELRAKVKTLEAELSAVLSLLAASKEHLCESYKRVKPLEARVRELEGELDRVSQKLLYLALKAEERGEA